MAQDDLKRIDRYHREISPALADEINLRIVRATAILIDMPHAGPAAIRGNRRKWRVPGTRYLLFYRIAPHHLRILRVLHGARDVASRL